MNLKEKRYRQFDLVREMMETEEIIRSFDPEALEHLTPISDAILLTGEGSSRIFPAKRIIAKALTSGFPQQIITENATQARDYNLEGFHVYVASNSGKTAEGIALIRHLMDRGRPAAITGIVANEGTPIAEESDTSFILNCGKETAVAATKSVVEQALLYDTLISGIQPKFTGIDFGALAEAFREALTVEIPRYITDRVASAPRIYFAGRNDGVAEELTLKTNEIARKSSDFLEGTYAVHGIEEVMDSSEVVILVDPFEETEEKFDAVLRDGVGLEVFTLSHRKTRFPTIRLPDMGELNPYVQLAAGWNLLVEVGLTLGIDLDTPRRARKVGNEYAE